MKLTFSTKNELKSPARLINENNNNNTENLKKELEPTPSIINKVENRNMLSGSRDINFNTGRTKYNMFEAIKPTRDCNCGK